MAGGVCTQVLGGGNCGNALTAAARLGLSASVVSKIGGDALGDGIVAEFTQDGVGTTHLLRAAGAPSPFTYIIVDRQDAQGFFPTVAPECTLWCCRPKTFVCRVELRLHQLGGR